MKNLLDIQQDLRKLENDVQKITKSIHDIQKDLESVRNANDDLANAGVDFHKIEKLSSQIPFKKHPLGRLEDANACKVYLEILVNLARLEPEREKIMNRMVFIQWLLTESRIDWSLEEVFQECLFMDERMMHELVETIPVKYQDHLIVDALILAGLSGEINSEIQAYVVNLIMIWGISAVNVKKYALIAKIALTQSMEAIDQCAENDCMGELTVSEINRHKHYILNEVITNAKGSRRHIILKYDSKSVMLFRWLVKRQGQFVNKGDIIADYQKTVNSKAGRESFKLISIMDGSMYFGLLPNGTYFAVISDQNDNLESIKAWVAKQGD